jgi:periplasmic protein CpxP/Spy
MNSIRNLLAGTAVAAAALMSAGAVFSLASAADTPTTAAAPQPGAPHGWQHRHHHGFFKALNLSDAQKASIKAIMQTNGPQMKSLHEQLHANQLKLRHTQPNDPNYSNVVSQTASANAPLHQQIDTLKATIRQEIFAKLTPAQQTQLQALEAQAEARHAARAAERSAGATPAT